MTTRSARRTLRIAAAASLTVALAGCGSTERSASAATTAPTTTASPTTTVSPTTSAATATKSSMRGQRYCEVLVVKPVDGRITADVYNTWPLNDCPADQWATLDATAIARAHGAPAALLNGPRYWLMDSITKTDPTSLPKESFGGLEMYLQASVDVGPLAEATTPYRPHAVDRKTVFTFDAGRTVHELHTADGSTFVMQTWSQMVDTHLSEADLDGLATRLHLPEGWTYTSRTLTQPLRIVTTSTAAQVLQDELRNSYSLETTG